METIIRDVRALDDTHRRAFEDVIGRQLQANQQLIIQVTDLDVAARTEQPREHSERRENLHQSVRPAQSLSDWTRVYEGLSEDQINTIERIAKTRANLTRHLP